MKTAMILAAGRGERLKPLTNERPKALCLIQGTPLIEYHVINLAKAGFERVIINHAYLGGKIRQHLGNGQRWGVEIIYSPEPPGALETQGAIIKALPLLGTAPFLTINADIYTDFDFSHVPLETLQTIHVILTEKNPQLSHHGDFGLTAQKKLVNTPADYILAGIIGYHPAIFTHQQLGRYSVTPLIREYAKKNMVTAELYRGVWFDIGSLARLAAVNRYCSGALTT